MSSFFDLPTIVLNPGTKLDAGAMRLSTSEIVFACGYNISERDHIDIDRRSYFTTNNPVNMTLPYNTFTILPRFDGEPKQITIVCQPIALNAPNCAKSRTR